MKLWESNNESILLGCLPVTYNIEGVNKVLPKDYELMAKNGVLKELIKVVN